MTEDEAKEALEEAELKVAIEEEYSKKIEAGYVISQDIAENTEIEAGSTVTIKVSTGVETSIVPNLIGKTEEEAKQAIKEAGLTLAATKNAENKNKDDGVVIEQNLDAGDTVEKGSNITITVNKIESLITGTVKLNLKSFLESLGRTIEYEDENADEDDTETIKKAKTCKVEIRAEGDTIYGPKDVAQDTTNISATVEGRGIITIEVWIDGAKKKTVDMNLKNSTTLTIE